MLKGLRTRRLSAGVIILLIAFALSSLIFVTAPARITPETLEKSWPVSVQTIKPESLAPVFNTYGRVESNNIAVITTPVSAEISRVNVREGEWANANEVLIELRKDELQSVVEEKAADLAQQRAALNSVETEFRMMRQTDEHYESVYRLAQKKLERQQELLDKRMISQALLDDAIQEASRSTIEYQEHVRALADFPNRIAQQKALVAQAEAQLQQAKINLDRTEIRAPFSGPVLEMLAAVGNHTSPSTRLLVIADASEFLIRAPVPNIYVERFRDALERGNPIHASLLLNGNPTTLALDRLSSNVHAGQSGLDAFFRLDTLYEKRLPEIGRVVDLTVTMPLEADVVALPMQSIYENDRVYRVNNKRLEAINVQRVGDYLTESGQYRILVRSPSLHAGQNIITTQLPRAISGLLVEPVNE